MDTSLTSLTSTTSPLDADGVAALGTTLCVWAHPDDESYLSAGLLSALQTAGRRTAVVTATLGEAGLAGPAPRSGFADLPPPSRADELAAALRQLGVAEHHQLGFADGGCADVALSTGAAAVRRAVAATRPDTVVTFGLDGFTGHPDHIAVGLWTRRALRDLGWRGRLLHPVLTATDRAAGRDIADLFGVYTLGEPRICEPGELAVRLELSGGLLDRKLGALRAHASQTAVLVDVLGVERYADWVGVESFADAALHA
ncbi:PIG-L deacetylase family protein [Cryptosporangium minutisporangium]|uniref:N-acetyl-1-D-myo-inositol-2-amino-2-deoxy-alpha-D -glucopyranoside deacetylase n=1 Tax=Cryptosporangium minutisporangium TaxID=113569 RepID=A0ABP6TAI3_9ACTN